MKFNPYTKRFILGFILGATIFGGAVWASEVIINFSQESLPILNEELRSIHNTLRDHEKRITALE